MSRFVSYIMLVFLAAAAGVHANTPENPSEDSPALDEYRYLPANIALYTPVAIAGSGENVRTNVGINLLYGKVGRMDGFEVAGLGNAQEYSMSGFQVAGLGNVTGTHAAGVRVAGLANVSGTSAAWINVGGLANIAGTSLKGVSVSGLANIAGTDLTGGSVSCLANISGTQMSGITTGGVINVAGEDAEGAVISPGFNVIGGSFRGIGVGGIINVIGQNNKGFSVSGLTGITGGGSAGCHIAGVVNVVGAESVGPQIAGLANIVGGDAAGMQVAGLANIVGGHASGLQIGVVNIANEHTGVPVGLYTRVSGIPVNLNVLGDETGFLYLELQSGNAQFNNFVTIGVRGFQEPKMWSFGYGVGRHIQLGRRSLDIDLLVHKIHEDEFWTNGLHMLTKVRGKWTVPIGSSLRLFVGASYNLFISDQNTGVDLAPLTVTSDETDDIYTRSWPGVFAGVGISFGESFSMPTID